MRERLLVLLGGFMALLFVLVLFGPKPKQPEIISKPLSVDKGRAGLYVAEQFLARNGVTTTSFRDRFSQLTSPGYVPQQDGNVLVVSLPMRSSMEDEEYAELYQWVAEGNTLLVLGAIDDSPVWSFATELSSFEEDTERLLLGDIEVRAPVFDQPSAEEQAQGPENIDSVAPDLDMSEWAVFAAEQEVKQGRHAESIVLPSLDHPLFDGVEKLFVYSDLETSYWDINSDYQQYYFRLGVEAKYGLPALWETRMGYGRILVSAYSSLLSNEALEKPGNLKFLTNIARSYLGPKGRFIFDDFHHGLTNLYDPDAFFSDPRLHNTLYFVIGFWLLYLLAAGNRLGGPSKTPPGISESEFVSTLANFIWRRAKPADVGIAMISRLFKDVGTTRRGGESNNIDWHFLHSSPLVRSSSVDELERSYRKLTRGEKVSLVKLHNQIHEIRKAFL